MCNTEHQFKYINIDDKFAKAPRVNFGKEMFFLKTKENYAKCYKNVKSVIVGRSQNLNQKMLRECLSKNKYYISKAVLSNASDTRDICEIMNISHDEIEMEIFNYLNKNFNKNLRNINHHCN